MNRGREGEANIHPSGVLFHRPVYKLSDFSECFYVWQGTNHLFAGEAKDLTIQEDVFASGELRIKACSQFQQRGNSPASDYTACCRLQNSADDLKQRTLPAAIRSDETDNFASFHRETNVSKRPKVFVKLVTLKWDLFTEPVNRTSIKPVKLGNVLYKEHGYESKLS